MPMIERATKFYREAIQLESMGRVEDAINRMHKAIELWEENDQFHSYQASLFLRVGAVSSAIINLKVALLNNPKNKDARSMLLEAIRIHPFRDPGDGIERSDRPSVSPSGELPL